MSGVRRLQYGDTVIEYLVRSRSSDRRVIAIHVEPDTRVLVEAPEGFSSRDIAAAVRKRAGWIHGHLQAIRARQQHVGARDWVSGESHRYLGRRYLLKVGVDPAVPERVVLSGGQLRVRVHSHDPGRVRELALSWYPAPRERMAPGAGFTAGIAVALGQARAAGLASSDEEPMGELLAARSAYPQPRAGPGTPRGNRLCHRSRTLPLAAP